MEEYIGCCFFLSGYRYLGNGGTNRHEILYDGTYRSRTDFLPFWGRCPRDAQIRNFWPNVRPFDREYLENGTSKCCMPIEA